MISLCTKKERTKFTITPRFLKFNIVQRDAVPQVRQQWRVLEAGIGGTSLEENMRAYSSEIL